jgi:hypothetical protein
MPQLDENQRAETVVPLCLWCEEPLDGDVENGMHAWCAGEYKKAKELMPNDYK